MLKNKLICLRKKYFSCDLRSLDDFKPTRCEAEASQCGCFSSTNSLFGRKTHHRFCEIDLTFCTCKFLQQRYSFLSNFEFFKLFLIRQWTIKMFVYYQFILIKHLVPHLETNIHSVLHDTSSLSSLNTFLQKRSDRTHRV